MEKIKTDIKTLRGYGILMGYCFLILSFLMLLKHNHNTLSLSLVSLVFFSAALVCPQALEALYVVWMSLAYCLGWINTRLLLCLVFYLLFFPMGLIMKLFGADLLDRKIEKNKLSYWQKRKTPGSGGAGFEKQF